ncbi:hypothetical protein BGZ81_004494 [Podila clonocystis]|nr:hypothetical protein BGZ81_004494 [Podila clonocystis]
MVGNSGASFASTSKTKIKRTATSAPVIVQHQEGKSESAAQRYARTVRTQWHSADLTASEQLPRSTRLRGSASADLVRLSSLPELSQETPRSSSVHLPERRHRPHRKSAKELKERKRSCSPPRRHVYTSFPIQQHLYSIYPQIDDDGESEEEERGICREPCCTSSSLYDKNHSSSKLDVETLSSGTRNSATKATRRRQTNRHPKSHFVSTNLDGLAQNLGQMDIHGRSYSPRAYSPGAVRDTGCSYDCEEEVQEEVEVMSFMTERPQDGLDAVQSRLRKGKLLHEQLANYFKERAHIEDLYAKNIAKAFQKHFVSDTQALGTFAAPWDKLSAESTELATLHGQFSLRISNEIEKPLRDFPRTSPEWQNLTLAEANCNRIAKEFDEKQVKVTKYTRAVERVSGKKAEAAEQKLMDYTKQLESTRKAWRLEGPVVLQKYHTVDQSRLEHMKQIVGVFEAIQTEIVLQIAEMSSRTSSSVAEFDPVMDIELYSSELSANLRSLGPHDGASMTSAHSHSGNGETVASLDTPRTNGGTHKRGMTASSQLSNVSYSTDRSFAQSKTGSVEISKPSESMEHARSGSSVLGSAIDVPTNHVDADGFTIPPPDNGPWSDAGMSSTYDDERSETSSFSQAPKMQMEIRQDSVSESNDEARAALERVTSTLKQTKTISRRHPGRREVRSMYHSEDSNSGFNSYQSSPLSSTAFTPDSSRDPSSSAPSPGSRVFFNTSAPHLQTSTPFSPTQPRASTLGQPSNSSPVQLQSSNSLPPPPSVSNGPASASSLGSLSILGGQTLATEPETIFSSGNSAPTSPITALEASSADAPGQHGHTGKQAWVASVVEKVHVHTQAGEVSKMMVTGEVILTLENTRIDEEGSAEPTPKRALLRLDQLQNLDKHIPNPAYLSNVQGADGCYWVDLESLSAAVQQMNSAVSTQGQGIVVLKYQVKTDAEEAKQTMIPLLIQPAWKCEPHQTSLLINYKANAQCKLATSTSSSDSALPQLGELSFLVPVSGEVVNVQSRPTGIWNTESNKMFWDVDPVHLGPNPEPHKLLARFEMNPTVGASQPSATAVKFRVQGQLLSDLQVMLEKETTTEEGDNKPASFGSVRLQVQSGRYLAMP